MAVKKLRSAAHIDDGIKIITLIVAVAIVAVLVSKNARTSAVLQAAWSAFANMLAAAMSPVTGGLAAVNHHYWTNRPLHL
jgi:hypothetical protein